MSGGASGVVGVSPREARGRLETGEAVLVDVREDEEWLAGRIPGSTHVPLGELRARAGSLPRERTLVVACRSGNRSALAAQALSAEGYEVLNLEGGVRAWVEAGLPFVGRVV
ncbi:rhodanese-like domain-containing protein [Rubrobacter xylanophilus]|uniref:rhodanese-like domain-containing protein n=1 Tax=Rubrobacter xylanophilus TaxID=49319 RepID=UPI0018D7F508|nr:rhodanese-like domain-containing protein [Rubrobacter xylanophilus]